MKNRNEELKRKLKKAASISLCAVLAGGLAAGTYTGVNYLTGYEQSVQAASEDKVELLKSEKKSDDSKDDSKDESTAKGSLDVSDIVEAAMPSIVSITTKSVEEVQNYYGMFGQYGAYSPSQEQEVQGSGSGIIIGKNDSELLIATNYHVVEGAETLSVGFCDSTACEAKVKGYDSEKDLAVVAVSLDDIDSDTMDAITIATIGNSDDLKVGAQVVAIGNALGYGQSVTTGIVSAKNRQLNSDDTVGDYDSDSNSATNLIQTRLGLLLSSLSLCLRFGSLTQFPPTLDLYRFAIACRGGFAGARRSTHYQDDMHCQMIRLHQNKMSRAAADNRSKSNRLVVLNAATPRAGIPIPEA